MRGRKNVSKISGKRREKERGNTPLDAGYWMAALLSDLFAAHKSLLTSAISRGLLARLGLTYYFVRTKSETAR